MKLKRIMASILAVCMVLSIMSFNVFAEDVTTPSGVLGPMYIQAANTDKNTTDRNRVYGEITDMANITESIVIKLYSNDVLLATTTLAKDEYLSYSTLGVNIVISGSESSSWSTVWEDGMPRADLVPNKAVLYIDGTEMNTADVTLNGIDNLGEPTVWETLPGVNAAAVVPTGTFAGSLINVEDENKTFISADLRNVYATESVVLKIYDADDTLLATTSLVDHGDILGNKFDSLSMMVCINCTDSYWNTEWANLSADYVPAYGVLYVDGNEMNTADISMHTTSGEYSIDWAEVPGVPAASITGLSGSGIAEDPFLINNLEELFWFRDDVNNGNRYNGKHIKLTADIDLEDKEWTPIGDREKDQGSFLGTFDGDNHTISNLWISQYNKTGAGFFSKVGMQTEYVSGTVKNITFNNVTIVSSKSYVGVIAQAPLGALIENVKITGDVNIQGYGYVGGIVGHGYPTINDSSVIAEGNITATYWGAGIIFGFAGDHGAKINNATVEGVGTGLNVHAELGGAAAVAGSPYGAKINGATVSNVNITSNSDYCMGYVTAGGTVENATATNVTATANGKPITPADVVAEVDGELYFDLESALNAATSGDEIKILVAGTYSVPTGKNITITGAVDGVAFDNIGAKNMGNANVTFNNVTFDYYPNVDYTGLQHSGNLVYNNCTFNGQVFLYGTSETFNNCIFNQESSNAYNVWTYSAPIVKFNECTFNSAGKSVLIYRESAPSFTADVEVIDCDFNASTPVDGKAAIEMDSSLFGGISLTIDADTTATGFSTGNVSGNSLWNNKKGNSDAANNDITVVVNGETVLEPIHLPVTYRVANKAELDAAIANAVDGDTILLTADIDYTGTASLEINKAVTLDLGGKTLTTNGTYGGLRLMGNCSLKNGILAHKGTVTAIKAWDVASIEDVTIDVAFKAEGKTIGGIVIQENAAGIDTIKNVTIKGEGLTNGIETYNCGNATENVIGSMENVTIDAVGTGMLISAPCGTATNCDIKGGTTGIEIWIKGTYSATLDLIECDIAGGVFAHDEFTSNTSAVNNGTLKLTADEATTGADEGDVTLTIARAEKVEGVLAEVKNNAVAKVNNTYYATLEAAIDAAQDSETITLLADVEESVTINKNITLDGADKEYTGTINVSGNVNVTIQNVTFVKGYIDHSSNNTSGNLIVKGCSFEDGGYAVTTSRINSVTIEDCTVTNQSLLYAKLSTPNITVKDVNISGGNYVAHIVYGNTAYFEDVTATNMTGYGICTQNYGAKTITLKNCSFDAPNYYALAVRDDRTTAADTFVFLGENSMSSLDNSECAKYVLAEADATLKASEGYNVTTDLEEYVVKYAGGAYKAVKKVAKIGETTYATLQEALDAAAAGNGNVTVEILADIDLTNVDWNPVTVSAPGYPVVTVNGNGKTITGLNDMLFAGTWAGGSGLIINDITIANSTIVNDETDTKGTVGVGAFIGFPQASATITLNNCHLVNSTVSGGHWTGGLIGYAAGYAGDDGPVFMNLTITGCSVTGSTITGKGSAGGVIGHGSGNGWTNVVIENTTVSGNAITSTGSSTNKAGAVMGTIGAAGQSTTAAGETKTGGAFVSATVSGNTVNSGGTTITTIYGRQGTSTGMLYVTGGTYDNYPIEEGVSYAAPAEGFVIEQNDDGTYSVVESEIEINPDIFGKLLFVSNMDKEIADSKEFYQLEVFTGIDSLNYEKVGFILRAVKSGDNPIDSTKVEETNTVYSALRVKTSSGETKRYTPKDINAAYMFGRHIRFNIATGWSNENTTLYITPFAVCYDGKEIHGKTLTITNDILKERGTQLFKEGV